MRLCISRILAIGLIATMSSAARSKPAIAEAPQNSNAHSLQVQASLTQSCPPGDVEDSDGDFARNLSQFTADLCFFQQSFKEGNLTWILQVIVNTRKPDAFFWVVPHDDEDAAFDSAVYAVKTYGGTVVAVHTKGERNNGNQDPNRNFDLGSGKKCTAQTAPSPKYTAEVMKFRPKDAPIVALHTNMGGGSTISILKPESHNAIAFVSSSPMHSISPNNTLVFVASVLPPDKDPLLAGFVKRLNATGIHVLYEVVSITKSNCSLSHYAALKGIKDYINIEVLDGDVNAQKAMVDKVIKLLPQPK
ncbi:hypothetical protein [Reyranella sp.]|uniref:hypothetical protein n=1 Tax=Reyranella sp. TaxID=1929291 RepID=UPI003F6EA426